jgi:FAD/FMN-containing dehydrogenase
VVTSLRVQLHPVSQLLAGFIMYPWSQAADVWTGLRALLADPPDELTVQSGFLSGPDGSPVLFLSPTWSGDLAQGQRVIDAVRALGTPLLDQVAPMTYGEVLGLFDPHVVNGRHYEITTRSVTAFTPGVVSALVQAGTDKTSLQSGISIHHFHGAATRVPVDSTAFGIRGDHFVVEIIAAWEPDDPAAATHRAWTRAVSSALAPVAIPGGYANLLGPDEHEQIAHAYGPNAARLLAAKARFDPDGVFTAIGIPAS